MHPLDCVRLKRTITWPGAPHRSVLLSGPASSAERRRRHKQMLWKALWNGRELVRTLPEPCRTVQTVTIPFTRLHGRLLS